MKQKIEKRDKIQISTILVVSPLPSHHTAPINLCIAPVIVCTFVKTLQTLPGGAVVVPMNPDLLPTPAEPAVPPLPEPLPPLLPPEPEPEPVPEPVPDEPGGPVATLVALPPTPGMLVCVPLRLPAPGPSKGVVVVPLLPGNTVGNGAMADPLRPAPPMVGFTVGDTGPGAVETAGSGMGMLELLFGIGKVAFWTADGLSQMPYRVLQPLEMAHSVPVPLWCCVSQRLVYTWSQARRVQTKMNRRPLTSVLRNHSTIQMHCPCKCMSLCRRHHSYHPDSRRVCSAGGRDWRVGGGH